MPCFRRAILLALVLGALPAAGQGPTASPPLPPEHWAVAAARRAEALGLAPDYLPGQRTATRQQVAAALRQAAQRAVVERPAFAAMTAGWVARLDEEFRELGSTGKEPAGAALSVAAGEESGRVAPGSGYSAIQGRSPTGAQPLDDRSASAAVGLDLALRPFPGTSAQVLMQAEEGRRTVRRWDVAAHLGGFALSAGRGTPGYGYSPGGGVTLSGAATLETVQLRTVRPVLLFRPLGRMALHAQVGRMPGTRDVGEPVFTSVAVTLQPHPRLTLAGYRAAIFGGDSAGSPLTLKTFAQTLLGLTQNLENGFANQVASLDVRFRLPTDGVLPITLYTEWGMEDLDVVRAVKDSPGGLAGVYLPALPGAPWLAAGAERVSFSRSCCGNGIWYRHFQHHGGWAAGDQPLGRPLGGHGQETAGYLDADLARGRLRVSARGFRRSRGSENLYAPGREGRSQGGGARAAWRAGRGLEVTAAWAQEQGDGWTSRLLQGGASLLF